MRTDAARPARRTFTLQRKRRRLMICLDDGTKVTLLFVQEDSRHDLKAIHPVLGTNND
jgi:hypothetical protein